MHHHITVRRSTFVFVLTAITTLLCLCAVYGNGNAMVAENGSDVIVADAGRQSIRRPLTRVNAYLFWGHGCPYCESEMRLMDELAENGFGRYVNIYELEVWDDDDNAALESDVQQEMGTSLDDVPLLVIGRHVFSGYDDSDSDAIRQAIIDEYMGYYDRYDVMEQL